MSDWSPFNAADFAALDPGDHQAIALQMALELKLLDAMNTSGENGFDQAIHALNQQGHHLKVISREGDFLVLRGGLPGTENILSIGASFQHAAKFYSVDVLLDFPPAESDQPPILPASDLEAAFYQRWEALIAQKIEDPTQLTDVDRLIYLLASFEAQVNNGGFLQYFDNTEGQYAAATLDALQRIGAAHAATLLEVALKVFPAPPNDAARAAWCLAMQGIEEDFREQLNELDERYYADAENLAELAARFLELT